MQCRKYLLTGLAVRRKTKRKTSSTFWLCYHGHNGDTWTSKGVWCWELFDGVLTLCPGVTFPSGDMQQRLVCSLYQEANISPEQVEYVEAHGTGTKVSQDPETHTDTHTCVKMSFNTGLIFPLGWGPTRSEWHCQCVLSVKAWTFAYRIHQIQHGPSRACLGTCCPCKSESTSMSFHNLFFLFVCFFCYTCRVYI